MTEELLEGTRVKISDLEGLVVSTEQSQKMHASTPARGRYKKYTDPIEDCISDFEWTRRRVEVEIEYVIALADELEHYEGTRKKIIERPFTQEEKNILRSLYQNFTDKDCAQINMIDDNIHHDLVAMTKLIKHKLKGTSLEWIEGAIHFALTSCDTNNIVYNTIIADILTQGYVPAIVDMQRTFANKSRDWGTLKVTLPEGVERDVPQPYTGKTHGQDAVPTTLAKILINIASAVNKEAEGLLVRDRRLKLPGKLSGAVGNNTEFYAAYPDHNWEPFKKKFVESFGLHYNEMTDQDDFNLDNSALFDKMVRINNVLEKWASDVWEYISYKFLKKVTKSSDVGSSTMPQKANPWRTEGGWIALGYASAEFRYFSEKLPKYRQQGDLRRSLLKRFIIEPFQKTLIGIRRLNEGINSYEPDYGKIQAHLDAHPELAAASLQNILRREGHHGGYDAIKKVCMNMDVDRKAFEGVVHEMYAQGKISEQGRDDMINVINPKENLGNAHVLWAKHIDRTFFLADRLEQAYKAE